MTTKILVNIISNDIITIILVVICFDHEIVKNQQK
jgi:hypothetical protein